jgi:hypothetical protein
MDWKPFLITILASFLVGGCSEMAGDQPAEELSGQTLSHVPATREVRQDMDKASRNAGGTSRLPGAKPMQRAESWQERLSSLDHDERRYLESVNARYFGLLEFGSAEEQQSQVENGYPTPEEWLAARRMAESELKHLARNGNPKGAIFYVDRELDRLAQARARVAETGSPKGDLDPSVARPRAEADVFSTMLMKRTGSPFSVYLHAAAYRGTRYEREAMAAAILVAAALGDARAVELAEQIDREGPVDFSLVVLMQKAMWTDVLSARR